MEIICVHDVDLSLRDFLGKPDVIFGYSPLSLKWVCKFCLMHQTKFHWSPAEKDISLNQSYDDKYQVF